MWIADFGLRIAVLQLQMRGLPGYETRGAIAPMAIRNPQSAIPNRTFRNREIRRIFTDSVATQKAFVRRHATALAAVVGVTREALANGGKLFFFGNGGSAADAQHLAAEFVNRFRLPRRPLPAIALTTDTSALTSIANDFGYAEVFAKQIEALGRAGDVAFAISTSGNSPSVLRAVARCRSLRITTVGLSGGSAGKLAAVVDHLLCVDSTRETARIQETHIVIGHALCELVENELAAAGANKTR
jgi:D-sedoheptulose 7-phosphate isomerase